MSVSFDRVPCTVITGFLGAGKTTLIRHLIENLKGKRLAGTRGGWGQFLIDATLEKAGHKITDATFAPLGPVDVKITLVAGSIDGWAVWEPYVSYAVLKDNARVVADGAPARPYRHPALTETGERA